MALIKYHTLEKELASFSKNETPRLFLICGESYLIKKAFYTLCSRLSENRDPSFSIEKLDGTTTPVGDIIEQVSTFSFLSSRKIVAVRDIPLFQTDKTSGSIVYTASDIDRFTKFIHDGWPPEHTLILTSTQADKRKKIYKTINESGMIIDCAVAQGVRKADQDEQRAVMQHVAAQVLNKFGKTLEQPAFSALVDLTGFNLDMFCRNLEKLAAYSADRPRISTQDVSAVVIRDKKDPIFNFTNAVMAKKADSALFFLNSLLEEGLHPLQILKSLENLFRKLLLVSDFLTHTFPNGANIGQMPFNRFQQTILPQIVDRDRKTMKNIEEREQYLTGSAPKKKDLPTELFLAPNPKNAYPVFQTFLKSENFSLTELCEVLLFLSDLDYDLKSSQKDARTQIENLIIKLCSKGGFVHAQKNQDRRHNF